ncbi:MAG TPA: DsbA family protein, partial [Solirubrobacterales bacterium]|nr:DsbA family protein [Solirubrobacterales bacterium]
EAAAASGMPFDPLAWAVSTPTSSYPACMALKAAAEQGADAAARYLRRLREGLMVEGRRLDHPDALIAVAGEAELDVARFRIDLNSPAILEGFAADLELTRDGRHGIPTLQFSGRDGPGRVVRGRAPYGEYRQAALGAGALPARDDSPDLLEAIEEFGGLATAEAEELTGRPAPVIRSELWAAARDWRLRAVMTPTGELWEKA